MEVLHPLVPASSAGLIPGFSFLQLSQEEGSDSGIMEGDSKASALATSEPKCDSCEDKDLIENLSKSKKPKLDLVFEEWDVAGLPWWFLGNLRSNYNSRSNGSTDIQTNQVYNHFKVSFPSPLLPPRQSSIPGFSLFPLPTPGFSASPPVWTCPSLSLLVVGDF